MEDLRKYNPEGSILRKAQIRMLDILKAVDAICRANQIPYFIEAGTLLGAVRHGGFIPWDDDLDICVMRSDYNRLRRLLMKNLPSTMIFQDAKTDSNYPLLIGKVRDVNSYFEEDFSSKLKYAGIYIDIFPIEKVPSWNWKVKLDYMYGHCVRALQNYTDKKDKFRSAIVFPFAYFLVLLTRFINHFISTDKVAYQYGREGYAQYRLNDIFPLQEIQFEDFLCMAPHNPDGLLKACYGDYMQIPPKEKRREHSSKIEFYD